MMYDCYVHDKSRRVIKHKLLDVNEKSMLEWVSGLSKITESGDKILVVVKGE